MPRKIKIREGRRNVTRHYTARGPGIHHRQGNGKKKPSTTRVASRIAHGPGSIYVESDMRQLVASGKLAEAAELFEMHAQKAWNSPMRWGATWYHQYKNGDTPQVREALLP